MRMLATLLVIMGLIVGAGGWINYSLHQSAENLSGQIDQAMVEVRKDGWLAAENKVTKLHSSWEQSAGWWPVVLDHQEMDNIEFSLARVKEYVANQDKALALGQLSELKLIVEHIPEKEEVTLKNIL